MTVRMADKPRRSAITQTAKVPMNCNRIDMGISDTRSSAHRESFPSTMPATIPPPHVSRNSGAIFQPDTVPVTAAVTANR